MVLKRKIKARRSSKIKQCLYLCIVVCLAIGCTFIFLTFKLNHDHVTQCSPKDPNKGLVDREDEWRYQNSITGEWYHWKTVYQKQNKVQEWRIKWLNIAPTSYLGVIVYLTTNSELNALGTSLTQLSRLLPNSPRPVIIFHEGDLGSADIQHSLAQKLGNNTPLAFERVEFAPIKNRPESVYRKLPPKYFDMCRFFTLMLPNHPLLTLFSFYWRLDAHSYIFAPTPIQDPFEIMHKKQIQYAFIMANKDGEPYVAGLWQLFHEFLNDFCLKHSNAFHQTQTELFGSYSLAIFFSNFAIANVSLFRDHSLVRAWVQKVDRSGNIYRYRWGDAPIHTLILTQLLPREHVVRFRYFGYMHRREYVCANGTEEDLCEKQVEPFRTNRGIQYLQYEDGCYPSVDNPLCHYYPEI